MNKLKVNAPRIKIMIDEDTIRNSVARDSSHCMIAEAVRITYPEAKHIAVDLQTIRLSDPQKRLRYTYLTPRRAQVALIKFDQGIMPEAFEIELRNGQVTKMQDGDRHQHRQKDDQEKNSLNRASLQQISGSENSVPDKIGGKTPPVQKTKDNIPFSRRRAFGIRNMDM